MPVPTVLTQLRDEATGRRHRGESDTEAAGGSAGAAGNARLTAATGVILLVLVAAQLLTLFDVSGLISWHVAIGVLLVPFALLKTASTMWRMGRYYTGHGRYRAAAPPMPLRLLGPLVVLMTLGLLGTGLALAALGPQAGRRPFLTVLGFAVAPLTLHQALFIAFAVVAGLHLLARIVPAVRLLSGRVGTGAVPGRGRRVGAILTTMALAAASAALVLTLVHISGWHHERAGRREHDVQSTVRTGAHRRPPA